MALIGEDIEPHASPRREYIGLQKTFILATAKMKVTAHKLPIGLNFAPEPPFDTKTALQHL